MDYFLFFIISIIKKVKSSMVMVPLYPLQTVQPPSSMAYSSLSLCRCRAPLPIRDRKEPKWNSILGPSAWERV